MDVRAAATALLAWYDGHARVLPWRTGPAGIRRGARPDPYHVWLSEIMLQQTTVVTVAPYFQDFIARWPDVGALAAADRDTVMAAWAGLGYYARARNLHACAQAVSGTYGGRFPESEAELLTLPGIGPYTAAAIAAIAFGQKAVVVDGNVERVMARLFAIADPLPSAKAELRRCAARMTPETRPGDYAQAVMDLGAGICTPKSPDCAHCPLITDCRAHSQGIAARLPDRQKKPSKPRRYGTIFWLMRGDGRVLLHQRPDKGLLGGMIGFPSSPWEVGQDSRKASLDEALSDALDFAPAPGHDWVRLPGSVTHVFTHFHLELAVYCGQGDSEDGLWGVPPEFDGFALPSLMKKVARHVADSNGQGAD